MQPIDIFVPVDSYGSYDILRYSSTGYSHTFRTLKGNINQLVARGSFQAHRIGEGLARYLNFRNLLPLPLADTPVRAWGAIRYMVQDIQLATKRTGGTMVMVSKAVKSYLENNDPNGYAKTVKFIIDESLGDGQFIVAYRGMASSDAGLVCDVRNGLCIVYDAHPLDHQYYRVGQLQITNPENKEVKLNW